MSNVYCDNYSTCNGVILDWSPHRPNDDHLRVRGWRTWKGDSLTGKTLNVTLCPRCVESHPLRASMVLEGQEALFGDAEDGAGQVVPTVRDTDPTKKRRT